MKKFTVLYCLLSDDQIADVNAKGWGGSDVGRAYCDAQYGSGDVSEALALGLYSPAATLQASSLNRVFEPLQNLEESWTSNPEITCHTDFPRSMSVGDIVYDHEANEFHRCASIGYEEIQGNFSALIKLVVPYI